MEYIAKGIEKNGNNYCNIIITAKDFHEAYNKAKKN